MLNAKLSCWSYTLTLDKVIKAWQGKKLYPILSIKSKENRALTLIPAANHSINLFTSVIYEKSSVFVPGKPFQVYVKVSIKARVYPSGIPERCSTLC